MLDSTGVARVSWGPPGGGRGLARIPGPSSSTPRMSRSLWLVEEGTQFPDTMSGLEPRGQRLQRPKFLKSTSEGPQDDSVWVP